SVASVPDSIGRGLGKLLIQPRTRHVPVARDGVLGDLQHAGDLFVVQTAKVTQLNDLAASRIHFCETLERFVEPHELTSRIRGDGCDVFERDLLCAAAAFCVAMSPRMI